MMLSRLRLLIPAALLAGVFVAPVQAADPSFPPGSRIGLAPPSGMTPSRAFLGYEDASKKAAILIFEMPARAFSDLDKVMNAEEIKRHGITTEKREEISIKDGKAVLIRGSQEANGKRVRKWLMIAGLPEITALITVEISEGAKDSYTDSIVRGALASVVSRPAPIAEQLGLLPFKLTKLAGFRVVRVIPNAVMLTDGPKDDADATEQSQFLIAIAPGAPPQDADRGVFARQVLADFPIAKDMRVTFSEPLRLNNQQGYEVRAEGKDARNGGDLTVVQWLRFGGGGYLRSVGVSAKDKWAELFPRFREIRDGIEPR